MKQKQIYMYKIQPIGFNANITIAFNKYPTVEQMINAINTESKKCFYPKAFIDACIQGITSWGVPKIKDDNQGVIHWKIKGESNFSSRGFVAVQAFNLY